MSTSSVFLAMSRTRFDVFNAHECFLGSKIRKKYFRVIWRHWPLMTWWFNDLISIHLSVKWLSDSKSAPQITLESSRTLNLRRTGWPVESMNTTCDYIFTFTSLALSQVTSWNAPWYAFSAWHDPSHDVIGQISGGSGSSHFQWDVKRMVVKLRVYKNGRHTFCR